MSSDIICQCFVN